MDITGILDYPIIDQLGEHLYDHGLAVIAILAADYVHHKVWHWIDHRREGARDHHAN